jgi:putative drug exporter of the RND superfamily
MIVRLTRWVLRHRRVVVVSWLLLAACGALAAASLGGALSKKFSIPGAAIRTNDRIARQFGTGGSRWCRCERAVWRSRSAAAGPPSGNCV